MKAKLLLVDDDKTTHLIVRGILEKIYEVVSAYDGVEALKILQSDNTFSLIMIDVMMPRMGGFELVSQIQTGHLLERPIIMISDFDERENEEKANDLGAYAWLAKPLQKEVLQTLVGNLTLP